MQELNLEKVEDTDILQKIHNFANYDEEQPSLFCVKMPFAGIASRGNDIVGFDVEFDVIEGDLPFLLGLPTLIAMGATVNHKNLTLELNVN